MSPRTPGKLPYLRGAELGHADHWLVPKAAAKQRQSYLQVRWVAHGRCGTRGMWHTGGVAHGGMSPCLGHHTPVTGLVLIWDSQSRQPQQGWQQERAPCPCSVVARLRDAIICLIFLGLMSPLLSLLISWWLGAVGVSKGTTGPQGHSVSVPS